MCDVLPPHRRSPLPVVSAHLLSVQDGLTALHLAVDNQNAELIRLLLKHDADSNIPDKVTWADAHMRVWRDGDDSENGLCVCVCVCVC